MSNDPTIPAAASEVDRAWTDNRRILGSPLPTPASTTSQHHQQMQRARAERDILSARRPVAPNPPRGGGAIVIDFTAARAARRHRS